MVLKIGILGAAGIAKKNARGIGKTLDQCVEVVAVGSRTRDKAEALIQEMGLPRARAIAGYDALIADPEVEAIYLPLPTGLHLEWVEKCARAGKHILCEKPIALEMETAEALVRLCEDANVQFMDGTMWVHGPRAAKLREALDSTYKAQLGPLESVSSLFFFAAPEAFLETDIRCSRALDGLGCLGDIGWYCVRYTLFAFAYEPPKTVQAHLGSKTNKEGVLMRCGASLLWADGRQATFDCGFDQACTQTIQISCKEGALRLDDFCIPFREDTASFQVVYGEFLEHYATRVGTTTETVTVHLDRPQETHMWEAFARCVEGIRAGGKPERRWHQEALLTQRVLCAVVRSVEAGNAPVPL